MPPAPLVRFSAPRAEATRAAALLEELLDLDRVSVAAFETGPDLWTVQVYGSPGDAPEQLLGSVRAALADAGSALVPEIEVLEEQDWVAASLAGLPPVRAGRVVVHGSHDRARVPANAVGVEIEAALAFGTGHHATTLGCLLALQDVLKRRRPRKILDLGTGTGVLAIAAARLTQRPVVASDIDLVSVRTARENARLNRAGALVAVVHASGLAHPHLRDPARFDLVLANILAEPLVRLSTGLAGKVAPGGTLILSGLLAAERRRVRAAYRNRGLRWRGGRVIAGWATLVFERPAA